MTTAIIEILLLLTVSCLIGVLFTYLYWKSKMKSSVEKIAELEAELQTVSTSLEKAEKEKQQLKADLKKAEEEKEKLTSQPKNTDTKKKDDSKALKEKIEILEEQLGEKERELEDLSLELEKKKISYYKQIDGKRYKAITLLKANEAVEGQGDGRISKEDAEVIFATISDGQTYTQVEKDTMRYLRDNYNWTEQADELFRHKVRSWAAKDHHLD